MEIIINEIISQYGIINEIISQYGIFILALFALFILILKIVTKIILRAILIIVASVIFPFLSRTFFGVPKEISIQTIFSFIIFGFIILFFYYFLKILWKISEIIAGFIEKISGKEKCSKKK
jgi:uncharacterized membrane protein